MKDLQDEIRLRFDHFQPAWQAELETVTKELGKAEEIYFQSYLQLVSLNTWRNELLATAISTDSASFFLEAQNDGLVSHVFARIGAWRSALKSLRSCLENVAFCLYFKDHPVELTLWKSDKYKPAFSSTVDYLKRHPALDGINQAVTGIEVFEKEYATLSKAVHGSAAFQMTAEKGSTSLWTANLRSLGKWRTRERLVLQSINLLLMVMFRECLQGTQHPQLRKAISFAVSPSKYAEIKSALGIALTPPR
jgi:hypothetical protein